MCAAGLQPAFHKATKRRQIAQGCVMGDSRTTPGLDRLAFPVCGVAGKGSVYCIRPVCRQAPDQGLILPVQIMSSEHIGQPGMRGGCLGRDHHAGCVFVQPVHNAGPGHPANTG